MNYLERVKKDYKKYWTFPTEKDLSRYFDMWEELTKFAKIMLWIPVMIIWLILVIGSIVGVPLFNLVFKLEED